VNSRIAVLNIDILNTKIRDLLESFHAGVLFTPNIDHLVLLQKDYEFYCAYKHADVIVLDSQVLNILQKIVGKPFKEKISGVDFFSMFCDYHKHNKDIRLFLLGGLNNSVYKSTAILNRTMEREIVVGSYSAPKNFEFDENACMGIIENITKSGANVLVVGIGSPRQEKWIEKYRESLPAIRIFMAVGGTFDVIAEEKKRAPVWVQKIGLEWLFRLIQEPQRLAYRYLVRDMQFFYYFMLDRLGMYKNPFDGKA
jgi:exopolysaccharide biosynthesis WecB/TagA/CpsF family protein